ncbi:DMT family transporter [Methylomonas paludis]|uniref:DMT family transporter n=1 Tax=Methylomonas paludis TaxID=1173101 RepID=A0A975MLS2_9GAMM|nr:DMT family transporter [Methylomonas paludis]QWF69944.1 DMT family transporter [Methylomonas paludis]
MRVKLAYLGVVMVWTTTPLCIKWSSEGISFILGVTARMSVGALCLLLIMLLSRQRLAMHKAAIHTYIAASVQIYLSMTITYWAAQFIPSGWTSVIFGLSPFMTAFLAAALLKESSLGWARVFAYLLGVAGLAVMFVSAIELNRLALIGMVAMLGSTFIHAVSAVWVKRIAAGLPAIQQISGGLLFSLPLYYLTWFILDQGQLPSSIPDKTLYAILYLGGIATTLGFALYYFLLTHLAATKVAMINMVTPVLSLLLGFGVNHEPLTVKIAIGTALILSALLIQQLAGRRWQFGRGNRQ